MRLALVGQLILVPVILQSFEVECSGNLRVRDSSSVENVDVRFYVHPFFSSISIDNIKVAENNSSTSFGQKFACTLPAGRHKVTIQSECCFEDEFLITVPEKEESWAPVVFRRRLRYLHAQLLLETRIRPLEIWIDGSFKGTADTSRPGTLTIPMKGQKGTRRIHILVFHPTLGEMRREILLRSGRQTMIKIERTDFSNPYEGKQVQHAP